MYWRKREAAKDDLAALCIFCLNQQIHTCIETNTLFIYIALFIYYYKMLHTSRKTTLNQKNELIKTSPT